MNKVLAGDYQILAESPDPDTVYTGSPCLAQWDSPARRATSAES